MPENKGLEFVDILIIIAKWKKFLVVTFVALLVISYLLIYLFVKEQYDANALIIPSEQSQLGGFSSLLSDISSLPLNLGGINFRNDIDLYDAIIFSRTNLEKVIDKFDLEKSYKVENAEEAIKILKKKITTEETDEEAFQIIVRAESPQKAAEMTNFIIDELNNTILKMNVKKSRDNRLFLEKRYDEIKTNLKISEDSLRLYQQKSGIYLAEEQAKSVLEAYTKLESELAVKEIELSVYEKLYGENSPQTNTARIAADQFSERVQAMKKGEKNSVLAGLGSLPGKAMNFIRYYRDVKIYNAMLEFIIPLYEQARFDEQKNIPVLQVIDYAVPPIKKSYPQRTLMALGISVAILFLIIFYLIFRGIIMNTNNPKLRLLKDELSLRTIKYSK